MSKSLNFADSAVLFVVIHWALENPALVEEVAEMTTGCRDEAAKKRAVDRLREIQSKFDDIFATGQDPGADAVGAMFKRLGLNRKP